MTEPIYCALCLEEIVYDRARQQWMLDERYPAVAEGEANRAGCPGNANMTRSHRP
jgi:hypothetical protein